MLIDEFIKILEKCESNNCQKCYYREKYGCTRWLAHDAKLFLENLIKENKQLKEAPRQ